MEKAQSDIACFSVLESLVYLNQRGAEIEFRGLIERQTALADVALVFDRIVGDVHRQIVCTI